MRALRKHSTSVCMQISPCCSNRVRGEWQENYWLMQQWLSYSTLSIPVLIVRAAYWDLFMNNIQPFSAYAPFQVIDGNHERDWPQSGTHPSHGSAPASSWYCEFATFYQPMKRSKIMALQGAWQSKEGVLLG